MKLIKALAGVLGDALTTAMRLAACTVVRPPDAWADARGVTSTARRKAAPRMYFFMQMNRFLITC